MIQIIENLLSFVNTKNISSLVLRKLANSFVLRAREIADIVNNSRHYIWYLLIKVRWE